MQFYLSSCYLLLVGHIHLITLFSNTLNLYSSLRLSADIWPIQKNSLFYFMLLHF
jgi:hypothetical protein